MKKTIGIISLAICVVMILGIVPAISHAAAAREIDASVDVALERFSRDVNGAKSLLGAAKGILVIPKVIQAGFVLGAEYGEGALRIEGKSVGYYNIVAASIGYQIGAQEKDIILIFMDEAALKKFRESPNWQAGVDGTVTLIKTGAEGSIDTLKTKQPIIGFVFGQKGLMAGGMLEGSKFTKLKK